jgi:hypothetical protein
MAASVTAARSKGLPSLKPTLTVFSAAQGLGVQVQVRITTLQNQYSEMKTLNT